MTQQLILVNYAESPAEPPEQSPSPAPDEAPLSPEEAPEPGPGPSPSPDLGGSLLLDQHQGSVTSVKGL